MKYDGEEIKKALNTSKSNASVLLFKIPAKALILALFPIIVLNLFIIHYINLGI